jgi:hypothetical protein
MSTSGAEMAAARHVRVTDRALTVELEDGRSVSVPLEWYPRLAEATPRERRTWALIGPGTGIHWPALDEDISVDGLLRGLRSGESAASFSRWQAIRKRASSGSRPLATRTARRRPTKSVPIAVHN